MVILPDRRPFLILIGLSSLFCLFSLFAAITDPQGGDWYFSAVCMFLFAVIFVYWAYHMRIVIHDEYFLFCGFLPCKKIVYRDVVFLECSYGHNGALSPINMARIASNKGVKVEINNFLFKDEDIASLVEKIKNSGADLVVVK